MTEQELDRAFSEKLTSSKEFCTWLLRQTKFHDAAEKAILLVQEQANARPKVKSENWWRHWWCKLPDGSESETDVLAVFGFHESDYRIAIHIEDKPPHGKFTPNQYLNYEPRAKFMANNSKFMNYSDFATMLLAPESFVAANADKVINFERVITYEDLSQLIPEFGQSLLNANLGATTKK